MSAQRVRWTIGVALIEVVAAACGGASQDAGGKDAATTPPASTAPAGGQKQQNACAFVDRAEIEKMAGKSLNMLHDLQDTDLTVCELTDPDNKYMVFEVKVYWTGGKEVARAEQAAMSMAKQMWQEQEDADMMELTGSEKIRGLADKAFYSDLLPSWVLKGDVMVQMIAPLFTKAQVKKAFLMTAKKALSQL